MKHTDPRLVELIDLARRWLFLRWKIRSFSISVLIQKVHRWCIVFSTLGYYGFTYYNGRGVCFGCRDQRSRCWGWFRWRRHVHCRVRWCGTARGSRGSGARCCSRFGAHVRKVSSIKIDAFGRDFSNAKDGASYATEQKPSL